MKVQKAFRYRFFPTEAQKQQLARTFGCVRFVYNRMLDARTVAWQQSKKSLNYHATAKMLTELKRQPETAFLNEVSSVVLQQALRNLDTAFRNFFEKRADYPTFKRAKGVQSARYANNAFTLKGDRLTLAKQDEPLAIIWSRPLPKDAEIQSVTVTKDTADRYFVSIHVTTNVKPLRKVTATVGIDVGLKDLAALSNGERLPNPKFLQKKERRLQIRQRRLSRKVKGSNNRSKARLGVAKIHAKVADTRKDYLHKFTTKTIRENQAVFVEGLAVVNLLKNHCLAKAIANAAWGEMFRQLEYKAGWYGRTYLELDRFFPSSKLCSACGHLLIKLPLSVREWDCPNCATHHDRDSNAAKNIEIAGCYLLCTESDARKLTPTRHEPR
ncbi:MAG TPA: RNA-guided endonuclease TnpB family protein [Blastocatellia bacterium]|nr:RNA-guided endonuclease TnpB family protein [Blastocatellia bacterium]